MDRDSYVSPSRRHQADGVLRADGVLGDILDQVLLQHFPSLKVSQ